MSGTYESRALDKLDGAITTSLSVVAHAADEVRWRQIEYVEVDDFTAIMQATIGVIMACETLATAADEAKTTCRAALAEAMALGATTVKTDHHVASLRAANTRVVVTDQAALPLSLMRQAAPAPDLTAIGALLRAGQVVRGAVLSNGGPDTLTIRNRKDHT